MNKRSWIRKIHRLIRKKKIEDCAIELTQFYPPSESIAELARIKKINQLNNQRTTIYR